MSCLSFRKKLARGAAGIAVLAVPIAMDILNASPVRAQEPVDWQKAAGGKMAFEVDSVKPSAGAFAPSNFPLDPSAGYVATNGRLSAQSPLSGYIQFAYKLWGYEVDLSHLPKWVYSDRYTIEARAATSNPTKDQMRLMMQSLLADRFQFTAHFEVREIPVLELRLAKAGKPGPKLVSHADGPSCDQPIASFGADPLGFPFNCHTVSAYDGKPGTMLVVIGSRDVTMDALAGTFSGDFAGPLGFDRPVIDKTGLTGSFDFTLEWARERRASLASGSPAPAPSDPVGPTVLQALNDQLGLKLIPTKTSLPILVIDRAERPSEN